MNRKQLKPHCQTTRIVERLRRWTIATDAPPVSDILDEAASELERLLVVIDSYAEYAAAVEREKRSLKAPDSPHP